uniref:SH3 domain-containing protein n=1 Tax=Anas platyrhynchos platyrhynchos TaxID=8840 RepID=A0A493TYL7_ANAPP
CRRSPRAAQDGGDPALWGGAPATGGRGHQHPPHVPTPRYRTEVKHIKVMTAEGLYRLTEKKAFKGLVELVEFYQRNSLKDCFKALDTALLVPFKEPESRAGPRPPGAVRSFGSAKARYDFCARDRTELTLREGDVIRVLSKKGHPGWWKGEIYGRVGWFPANYVEEDYSEYC